RSKEISNCNSDIYDCGCCGFECPLHIRKCQSRANQEHHIHRCDQCCQTHSSCYHPGSRACVLSNQISHSIHKCVDCCRNNCRGSLCAKTCRRGIEHTNACSCLDQKVFVCI
ncbi:hypothetical protein HDV02_005939, partial [Globomyces sp. JEL0801]